MNILVSLIGCCLIAVGLDGYFNNGALTHSLITPNYDIAMTMIITGCLVLASSICLCEFGQKQKTESSSKALAE